MKSCHCSAGSLDILQLATPNIFLINIHQTLTILFIGAFVFQPTCVERHNLITNFARKNIHPRQFIDKLKLKIFAENCAINIENSNLFFFWHFFIIGIIICVYVLFFS